MKKKNLLAENMLRFGVKNLSQTAKHQIINLFEQDEAKTSSFVRIGDAIPAFSANNVAQLATDSDTVLLLTPRAIQADKGGSGAAVNVNTAGEGNLPLGALDSKTGTTSYALGNNSIKFIINMGNYYIALGMNVTGDMGSPTITNQIIGHAFTLNGTGYDAGAKFMRSYEFDGTFIDSCAGLSHLMNGQGGPGVGTVGAAVTWFFKYLSGGNLEPYKQLSADQQTKAGVRNANELKNMTDEQMNTIAKMTPSA